MRIKYRSGKCLESKLEVVDCDFPESSDCMGTGAGLSFAGPSFSAGGIRGGDGSPALALESGPRCVEGLVRGSSIHL